MNIYCLKTAKNERDVVIFYCVVMKMCESNLTDDIFHFLYFKKFLLKNEM